MRQRYRAHKLTMPEPSLLELKKHIDVDGTPFQDLVELATSSPEAFDAKLKSFGYSDEAEVQRLRDTVKNFAQWAPAKSYLESQVPMPPKLKPTAPPRPPDPTGLTGEVVTIHDLTARPELNGRRGRVLRYDPDTGRLAVQIKDVGKLALHPRNLWTITQAKEHEARRLAEEEEEAAFEKAVATVTASSGKLRGAVSESLETDASRGATEPSVAPSAEYERWWTWEATLDRDGTL